MTAPTNGALRGATLGIMAAGAALGSATIQANQPLLPTMASSLDVQLRSVAFVPSTTQWGYALGLALIVPLFDVVDRRRLVIVMQSLAAIGLLAFALAPSARWLLVLAPVLGVVACASQILTPYAGAISPSETRAHAVATVLGGVLAGVLIGRVLGGFLGAIISWRAVYVLLAIATIVSLLLLSRVLPQSRDDAHQRYVSVLGSMVRNLIDLAPLRRHSLIGLLVFGSFMTFWSSYSIQLKEHFGIGPSGAGLIALVGLAGALAAPRAGRLVDRGGFVAASALGSGAAIFGWCIAMFGAGSVFMLAAGALVLDLGTGLAHGANMSALQRRYPTMGGRINAVYMVMYFIGGATCAAIAPMLQIDHGWHAVALFGAGVSLGGLALVLLWRRSLGEA
mgnify:CR=1 FL=1